MGETIGSIPSLPVWRLAGLPSLALSDSTGAASSQSGFAALPLRSVEHKDGSK